MEYLEFFSRASSICTVDSLLKRIYTKWSLIFFCGIANDYFLNTWIHRRIGKEDKPHLSGKRIQQWIRCADNKKNLKSLTYIFNHTTTFAKWKTYLAQCQLVHTNVVKISKNYTWNLVKWRERPSSFESQNVYELKSFIWSAALVCVASVVVVTIVVAYLCGWLFEFE